jgi:protein-tyrosine kinase
MSRIHEALKKAAEERATAQSVESPRVAATARIETTPEVSGVPPIMGGRLSPLPPHPSGFLRFDEIQKHCARPDWNLDPNQNIFLNAASPLGTEQFRTLRSRLYQIRGAQPLKTILITSGLPAEGKTFVASNLAQAIARQPDRRVLLIDADLRRPRLHVPLGAPSAPGLTDYLRGEADELRVIQQGPTGGMCFIPGGNEVTDPGELITNGRLKILLDRLAPVFDWLILDSPPCVPVHDASLVADLCDGVILVVRSGSTPIEIAERTAQEMAGRNVVGVVLNAATDVKEYGSYYYYSEGNTRELGESSR